MAAYPNTTPERRSRVLASGASYVQARPNTLSAFLGHRARLHRGETLTETLASIAVCVIATAALLSAVTVASHINQSAGETQDDLSAQMQLAETHGGYQGSDAGAGSTQITIDGVTYDVQVSGGDDVVSYVRTDGEGQ